MMLLANGGTLLVAPCICGI